ncbi:unnamed protein product [Ilex paraguariensis]|uniref:Uncharacterized protein n=1 Tax=Ilex paraguariensis TaxID=185542 RepID=A0ABC8UWF3_9AQUA
MSYLSIRIDEKYASSSHTISVKPYIFRVDELLHKENKMNYEPEILAIDFSVEVTFKVLFLTRTSFIRRYEFRGPFSEVDLHHLLGVMSHGMRPSFLDDLDGGSMLNAELTRCAKKLQEAGIKFKVNLRSDSWMDIEFKNGIMRIPPMFIDDDTKQLLRNLIAYEQYNHRNEWAYVTSYVKFLNCLIMSPNDVKILRQK